MRLTIFYILFAAIASFANIFAQDVFVRLYHGVYAITLSIFVGTFIGLLVKYWLDKRYIFRFRTLSAAHDIRTFVLYSAMGVLTTVIFWAFEFGFQEIFQTKQMRYLGGLLGLSLGYFLKYKMDKRFVFVAVD
ncbi:GtrA family protein [Extensimonas vulgaris]|uniref:GtrA-like protein n=2 Tax=Extensimonas vulgaris TaxID=1031594 RepID=A0A369AM21_9BURK|nr:GtrA family protein [Extensimonas vulgaris]RCX09378.1 GtrA-like protein [Extensimonas vulgaris]TWI38509.1 GtrA-like protein [Extensimonas vulgaris]TXD13572.1 GtrA family protein [Extensimonas vulgaris]